MSEWIKCSDRLPQDKHYVLAYNGLNMPIVLQFFVEHDTENSRCWFQQTLIQEEHGDDGTKFNLQDYLYWHPLPEPPND